MNKEQFIDTLQACYFGDRGAFNKIVKEYDELHNKIDRAIEYIKNKTKIIPLEDGGGLELCDYDIQNLLEILKDSDVE